MPQISCRDLTLGYERRPVAEHLNFTVDAGDYLCVVGENGTGKSTLLRTLLRLQPPMSGAIEFGDGMCSCQVGYLPQQTAVQKDFPASVREVVLSGCLNHCTHRPFFSRGDRKIAEKNMQRLGIESLSRRCFRELSGGQQQRVLLARALCSAHKMLVLDEPVAGLDPIAAREMYEVIGDLNARDGLTILMVSHDTAAAVRYATHILHLNHDAYFFGTTQAYLDSEIGRTYTLEQDGRENDAG